MHTYHFKLGSNYIWIEIGIELEHNKNCFKLKSKWKYLEREEHWLVEGRCQTYIQKGKQENLEKYRKVKSTLIHVGFYAAVPLKNFEVWDGEEVYWAQPVWIYDKRFLLYHHVFPWWNGHHHIQVIFILPFYTTSCSILLYKL